MRNLQGRHSQPEAPGGLASTARDVGQSDGRDLLSLQNSIGTCGESECPHGRVCLIPPPSLPHYVLDHTVPKCRPSIRAVVHADPVASGIHASALLLSNGHLSSNRYAMGSDISQTKTGTGTQETNRPAGKATLRGSSLRLAFRFRVSSEYMDWA